MTWLAPRIAWLTSIFYAYYDLVYDIYSFWHPRVFSYLFRKSKRQELLEDLQTATSFAEWNDIALKIDTIDSNDVWRANPASEKYDYKLIAELLFKMDTLREEENYTELAGVVRSLLFRNMGSISASELFTRGYSGTKLLIEEYITSVVTSLECLASNKIDVGIDIKTFIRDCRQSFGRTALVLRGDPLFGMCHLGVVKSLLSNGLLPSVITGAAISSIVAAYICSMPEDQVISAIDSVPKNTVSHDASDCERFNDDAYEQIGSVSEGAYRSLYTNEAMMFFEFVSSKLGNMTFEESYKVSGKVLNIAVLPENASSGIFFNYLSAPNVVIKSAMLASIGTGVLPFHHKVDLYVKDYNGVVKRHPDAPQRFLPSNQKTFVPTRDSPYTRLSELFNVNNYVVSVSRPYFAPILLSEFKYRGRPKFWQRILSLTRISVQYRISQFAELGLLSQNLKSIFFDEIIPGGLQVNIVPETNSLLRDLLLVFDSTSTSQKLRYWIRWGEKSVWPHVSLIWVRSKIEYVLEDLQTQIDSQ